ncbi:MAG: hypothetical protein ACRDUX_11510 [Mycobacterium sp.]
MHNVYMITYDLRRPNQDYKGLYEALRNFAGWCHGVDSTWFVSTQLNAEQIRSYLQPHLDRDDRLIVTRVGRDGAWQGLQADAGQWLQNNL